MQKKNMTFSKRIVLVYTFIVTIPLILIMIVIFSNIRIRNYSQLKNESFETVNKNKDEILRNLNLFDSIEQMISGNSELMMFFRTPENFSEEERIQTLITESDSIERTLSVMPNIYGLRVFANSTLVPERWPIIMRSSRTDLYSLRRWEFNYAANYIGNMSHLSDLSVCSTRILKYHNSPVGYLQMTMKMQTFFPFLFEDKGRYKNDYVFSLFPVISEGEKKSYAVSEVTNSKIAQCNESLSAAAIQKIQNEISEHYNENYGTFTFKKGFKKSYFSWIVIPDMNIAVVNKSSFDAIRRNSIYFEFAVVLSILLTVAILFFIIRQASKKLLSGVYSLIAGMKKIQHGDYSTKIKEDTDDEVGEAQRSFNKMVAQLNNQIELIKEEEHLIAETEMKAMQNQINAHFLYNILETIKMQAVIANEDDIAESLTVLGKLMHYSLRWKIHIVNLSQEVDYIRSYIYLLNLRNDYVISLQTEIPAEYNNIQIPKMILQPLVENSFSHGIEPEGKDSVIKVFSETHADEPNRLYLCVQDFGIGISPEKCAEIQNYLSDDFYEKDNTGSIGLKNIQQRLVILYGKDFRMKIESEVGRGTCIKIPIKLEDSND